MRWGGKAEGVSHVSRRNHSVVHDWLKKYLAGELSLDLLRGRREVVLDY